MRTRFGFNVLSTRNPQYFAGKSRISLASEILDVYDALSKKVTEFQDCLAMIKRALVLIITVVMLSGCQSVLQALAKVSPEEPAAGNQQESAVVKSEKRKVNLPAATGNAASEAQDLVKQEQSNALLAGRQAVISVRLDEICSLSDFEKNELKQWAVAQDILYLGNTDSPFKSYYEHGKGVAGAYTRKDLQTEIARRSEANGLDEQCRMIIQQAVSQNEHRRSFDKTLASPQIFSF